MENSELFAGLSNHLRMPILIEGFPLAPINEKLISENFMAPISPRKKLEIIAAGFDYDMQVNSGVILLKKKFTDDSDHPCVSFEEIETTLRECLNLSSQLIPPQKTESEYDAPAQLMRRLYATMDFGTQSSIVSSGATVPIASLQREQKEAVYNALASMVYIPIQSDCKQSIFLFDVKDSMVIEPSNNNSLMITYKYQDRIFQKNIGDFPADMPTFTRPGMIRPYDSTSYTTLSSGMDTLNDICRAEKTTFKTTANIADKPIRIFGAENMSGRRLVHVLGQFSGLRIALQGNALTVMRPTVAASTDPSQVYLALRTILPDSLWRCMYPAPATPLEAISTPAKRRSGSISDYAAKRLVTLLQPQLKKKGKLKVADLSSQERSLLGLAFAQKFLSSIGNIAGGPKPYFMEFDTLVLRLRTVPDGKFTRLQTEVLRPTGQVLMSLSTKLMPRT